MTAGEVLALGFATGGFVDSVAPVLGGVADLIGLALTTPDFGIVGCPITPEEPADPYEVGGGFAELGFAGIPEVVLEFESPTGELRLDRGTELRVSDLVNAGGRWAGSC